MSDESVRPWGHYEVLYDGDDCKVKRIIVKPGGKLSYQYHFKREEFWKIISGFGVAILDDYSIDVGVGLGMSEVFIKKEMKHRIENTGTDDLVFIEIQIGTYFGEDDIVRIEDDYGRVTSSLNIIDDAAFMSLDNNE